MMKSFRWLLILSFLIIFSMIDSASGATYSLHLKYQGTKDFPNLQQKMGSTLGMVPFKDERLEALYIGHHLSVFGSSTYFKSDPYPLERAMKEFLSGPLFRYGIKSTPIPDWDGKPESLKDMETDSVLMIQIKRFWIEGNASPFRTSAKTSIHFVIHLGVKKEAKVFTKNVEVEREATLPRLTPEWMEKTSMTY